MNAVNLYYEPDPLIEQWASSHETDQQIAEAIFYLSGRDESRAERIWNDPTDAELRAIWERATGNGALDDTLMCWGESTLAQVITS